MPAGSIPLANLVTSLTADPRPLYRTLGAVKQALPGLLALGGVSGISIGLGAAAKTSIDLEQSLINLDQVTDLTREQLTGLRDSLEQLAIRMKTVPVKNLFEIATAGAKLGLAGDDLLAYTEGIIKASSAIKEVPVGILADDLGRLNNQFKLGADGGLFLASAIGKVASSGTSAPEQILDIASRISGLATVAKISAPQVIALSGAIADSTKYSEAAAGALIVLIQNLNNLDSRQGFADTIGISAAAFADLVHDKPIQAITDFLGALKNLDAESQGTALASIGIEGIRGLGNLEKLSQSFQDIIRYEGIAGQEVQTAAFAIRAYSKDAASTGASLKQLGNEISVAARKFGDELAPKIRSISEAIGPLIGELPEFSDSLGRLSQIEAYQPIRDLVTWFGTLGGSLDGIQASLRNFDLVWQETATRLGVLAFNAGHSFELAMDTLASSLDFGLQFIQSWTSQAYNEFVDLFNKTQPLFAFFADPLAKADITVPKLKIPEIGGFIDPEDAVAHLRAELQRREDSLAAERFEKGKVSGAGTKGGPSETGTGTGTLDGGAERNRAAEFLSLEEFARRLQSGALGKDSDQAKTARNTEKIAGGIDELVKINKQPAKVGAVAVGPE